MDYAFTHQPSYTHLVVDLDPGETVRAEPGAMVSHSAAIDVSATTSRDGVLKSVKSVFGGESFFAAEFTAADEPGRVTLAPGVPGDVQHHELAGGKLYAVDGAFLASGPDVDIDAEFGGLKSVLAGASLTPLALSGTGPVFLDAFGGIEQVDLAAGERYVVDNDHVVAWEETVDFDATLAGGITSAALSGEGLVMEFTGPGSVWYQTRGREAFVEAIVDLLPTQNGGE
ncbi:MAG: TIGR00266 family protein [Halanaeroarchaeum sp.]